MEQTNTQPKTVEELLEDIGKSTNVLYAVVIFLGVLLVALIIWFFRIGSTYKEGGGASTGDASLNNQPAQAFDVSTLPTQLDEKKITAKLNEVFKQVCRETGFVYYNKETSGFYCLTKLANYDSKEHILTIGDVKIDFDDIVSETELSFNSQTKTLSVNDKHVSLALLAQTLSLTGNTLTISGGGSVTFAGWDTNANDDVKNITQLQDVDVSGASNGQVLKYNGSKWVNATDSDSLGNLSCSNGQIAKWNGSAWVCASDDIGSSTMPSGSILNATVRWNGSNWVENGSFLVDGSGVVTAGTWNGDRIDVSDYTNLSVGNGLSLNGDAVSVNAPTCSGTDKLTWDGSNFVCSPDIDTDTLASLNCNVGQVAKWDGNSWSCADDTDTDTDTLATLNCSNGQIAKWNGSAWVCAGDEDSDTLASLSCSNGQVAKWNGSSWICASDDGGTSYTAGDGLALSGTTFSVNAPTCANGEVLTWDGSAFNCVTDQGSSYTAGNGLALSGTEFSVNAPTCNNGEVLTWNGSTFSCVPGGDTLASLNCSAGQVAKWDGSNWNCADDTDTDTLATLSCSNGEVAKWDGNSWSCATDEDNDTLAGLSCSNGQIPKWDGNAWTCANDDGSASYTAGNGLTLSGTEFSVNAPTCSGTDKLTWNGSQFVCSADVDTDTLAGLSCSNGQVAKWDGSNWSCANDEGATYSASGTLLQLSGTTFSLKEGTLTDGYICKYTDTDGLVCDIDPASLNGGANQTLSWDATNDQLSISGGNTVDLSDLTQTLSLSGDTLSISSGNSVDLSVYRDNTDSQTLTLSGTTLSISGGNSVNFAGWDTDASDDVKNISDLLDVDTSTNAPTNGQVLKWDGNNWVPGNDENTDTLATLSCSNGQVAKWDGSNWVCADDDGSSSYTAGNGLTLSGTEFSVNAPTCASGQVLTWDGSNFSCVADSDTTYTAGNGLTLSGTEFTVDAPTCNNGEVLTWDGNSFNCVTAGDTLANLSCNTGQVAKWDGSNWVCADDTDTDTDTLATLSCSNGQVAKWDGNAWSCANDEDSDTLAGLSCSNGEIVKWDGSSWTCSVDQGTALSSGTTTGSILYWNGSDWVENTNYTVDSNGAVTSGTWNADRIDISDYTNLSVGNGLSLNGDTVEVNAPTCSGTDKLTWNGNQFVCSTDEDNDTLAGLSCSNGQIPKWDGNSWSCANDEDDDTLASLSCSNGEVAKWNGSNWVCASDEDTDTTYTASGALLQLSGTTFSVKEGTLTNGYLCTYSDTDGLVCDTDPSGVSGSDNQTLSWDGNNNELSISNGNTVDLSELSQTLSLSGNILTISDSGSSVDLSGYLDNTDNQILSLSGTTLSISGGNSVDFSGWDTNVNDDVKNISDLLDVDTTTTTPTNGQVLKWDGSNWVPDNDINTDTLASLNCNNGQVAKWDGNSWSCADDIDTNTDTLATLSCSNGQIAKWDGNAWSCANDEDSDTLAGLSCSNGQVAKWDGSNWVCASDQGTALSSGTTTGSILYWNGVDWVENTNYTVDSNGAVTSGTWNADRIDISDYTNLSAGNGLSLNGDTVEVNAPTCSGTDKLTWNGSQFVCSTDIDTDTLASLSCNNGEVAKWDGNNWVCSADENSNTTYTAGNGLSLSGTEFSVNAPTCANGEVLTWDGSAFSCVSDKDTTYTAGTGLALTGTEFSLNAKINDLTDVDTSTNAPANGQVLKWDGSNWVPDNDINTDTLASLNCNNGQVAKWDGNSWSCADDIDTNTDTLATLSCSNGQIAKWDGNAWSCANDEDSDTLAGLSCSNGQVAKWDGSSWVCASDQGTALSSGTTTGSILYWNGVDWVENTNYTVDSNGAVTSGTWNADRIDISDYTNLSVGNGLSLNGDTVEVNAPTCNGSDKLTWNGSQFVCSTDIDTDTTYGATGTLLQLSGTTFSVKEGTLTDGYICRYSDSDGLVCDTDPAGITGTDSQTLSWDATNDQLSISGGNTVDMSDLTQSLSFDSASGQLSISSGNSVDLSTFWDNTDSQTLSLSGTTLSISGGNSVDFSGWDTNASDDVQSINDLTDVDTSTNAPTNGQVLKWNGSNWVPDNDIDTDTLANLNCSNGQVAKWDGNSWSCADDIDTDTDTLATLSCSNGQIAKWDGSAWSCANDEDTDTLAGLSCNNGEIAKWNGSSWTCSNDDTGTALPNGNTESATLRWNGSSWVENGNFLVNGNGIVTAGVWNGSRIDISDYTNLASGNGISLNGDTIEINAPTCNGTDKLTWDGTQFVCVTDTDTTYTAGNGLVLSGTEFAVDAPTCNSGEVLTWDGSAFSCVSDADTLAGLSCNNGEIAKWNGSSWTCSNDDTGTALPNGNTESATLRWNGSSWVENGNFLVDGNGIVTAGVWNGSRIDISDYTNLASGNGISLNGDTIEINAPTCNGTDKLSWDGTQFVCVTDTDTTYTAGNGLALSGTEFAVDAPTCNSGEVLTWDGSTFSCVSNTDTLATLNCNTGQVAKWDGSNWTCADDIDTDTDTLATLSCSNGQIAKWDGSNWVCGNDEDSDTLGGLNCSNGQVAKWNGSSWVCADDIDTNTDTLADLNCNNGEIAKWDGSNWVCSVDENSDTTYTAGNGLTLNGTEFAINSPTCNGTDKLTWNGSQFVCSTDIDTDTTYGATGTLLQLSGTTFSVKEGTLTDGYICRYSDSDGLVCDTDPAGITGTDSQTLSWDATNDQLSISGGNTVDMSDLTQSLSFDSASGQLSISSGNSVDLSTFWDNTDSQTLSLSGTTLSISGGNSVDFSGWDTNASDDVQSINDLTDVDTSTNAPTNGQVLKWNGSNWVPDNDIDTDTLANLNCSNGQVAKWDGNSWSCADDIDTDTDTLATLSCSNGQIAKWDGSAWSCANDEDTDTLAGLSCNNGEVAKWDGSQWVCASDQGTALANGTTTGSVLYWDGVSWVENTEYTLNSSGVVTAGVWNGDRIDISDYTNLASGNGISLNGDTVEVNAPTCSGTEKLTWNGSQFVCNTDIDTDTLASLNCSNGQIAKWDGSSWVCSADENSDTTYSASGALLQLSGTTFSVKEGVLTNGYLCTYSDTDGLVCNTDVSSVGTDNQTLSLSGNTLSISGGNSVDLSQFMDNTDSQTLSWSASNNELTISNGNTVDLGDLSQTLNLSGDTLTISDSGSSVDLSKYLDNTDNQTLSLSNNNLSISGGNSVDLSVYLDNTDDQTVDVFEIQSNVLHLSLEDDGQPDYTVDLSGYLDNTDSQTLSLSGTTLSISGGNSVDFSGWDTNASDDVQSINDLTDVNISNLSGGQVLKYDGTNWVNSTDADTLATLSCNNGEVAKWDGSNWVCSPDENTDTNTTYTAGDGLFLAGTEFNIDAPTCSSGQVLTWTGSAFSCVTDADTTYTAGTGLALSGTEFSLDAGIDLLTDVDTSTNAPTTGQVLKYDGTNWVNSTDADTLAALSCNSGEVAKWDGNAWSCATDIDTDTLATLNCSNGQVAKWDGSNWSCADDTDTNTTYTAGTGLALSGTEFSLDAEIDLLTDVDTTTTTPTNGQVLKWDGSNWVPGNDLDTTYTAGGTLLQLSGTEFSVKEGTLTDGYLCTYSDSDGLVCNTTFTSVGTDSQTLSWDAANDRLSISGGNTVDMSDLTQSLSFDSASGQLSISSGNSVDLSTFWDNTDSQTLSLSGDTLSISNGNSVDLSAYKDNTDNQTVDVFEIQSNVLHLSLENDGQPDYTVDLSSYLDNTDSQTLSLSGTTLSISGGNSVDFSGWDTNASDDVQSINDLTDVDTSTNAPTNGQTLKWNGTNWVPADDTDTTYTAGTGLSLSGTEFSLSAGIDLLTDVDTSTNAPVNGQVLKWNGSNWVPDNDTDTDTLASLSCNNGEVAKWDGSNWVCSADQGGTYTAGDGLTLSGSEFSVDSPTCSGGQVLTWNGSDFTCVTDKDTLAGLSCNNGEIAKWDGTDWVCDTDDDTSYGATGALLQLSGTNFSVKEGTLTNGYICTYSDVDGLVCNTDPASLSGSGGSGSYWQRNGSNLSPLTAGDDILLNTGETLTISDFTKGGVVFASDNGLLAEDSSAFFWDETNQRLGVGMDSPEYRLDVSGAKGVFRVHDTYTATTGEYIKSFIFDSDFTNQANDHKSYIGMYSSISVTNSGDLGVVSPHSLNSYLNGGGTASDFSGLRIWTAPKAEVTSAYGINAMVNIGNGTDITHLYGIYLHYWLDFDPDGLNDVNVQSKWGIYSWGGWEKNYLQGKLSVGDIDEPSAQLSVSQNDSNAITNLVDIYHHGYTSDGNNIGVSQTFYTNTKNGTKMPNGKLEFVSHIAQDGQAGDESTNNASYFKLYVERQKWDNFWPAFATYITGSDRLLCMNGTENNDPSTWDCFGMTIGSANAVTFWFDQIQRASVDYDNNQVRFTSMQPGNRLVMRTLGTDPISLDVGNDGADLYVSSEEKVGIGTVTPTTKLDVHGSKGAFKAVDEYTVSSNTETFSSFIFQASYENSDEDSADDKDYTGLDSTIDVTIEEELRNLKLHSLKGTVDGNGMITELDMLELKTDLSNSYAESYYGLNVEQKLSGGGESDAVYGLKLSLVREGTNTFVDDNWGLYVIGYEDNYINGNLGLKVLDPAYTLQLPNDSTTGNAMAYSWSTYSDSRVKTEQKDIEYGLSDLMKLKPKSYIHHKSEFTDGKLVLKDGVEEIGLIAQEVYKVIPEAVSVPEDESNQLWGIDYERLIPVIIKSVQELANKVDDIESRLEVVETQMEKQKLIATEYGQFTIDAGKNVKTVSVASVKEGDVIVITPLGGKPVAYSVEVLDGKFKVHLDDVTEDALRFTYIVFSK